METLSKREKLEGRAQDKTDAIYTILEYMGRKEPIRCSSNVVEQRVEIFLTLISNGLATIDGDTIAITTKGYNYIKNWRNEK